MEQRFQIGDRVTGTRKQQGWTGTVSGTSFDHRNGRETITVTVDQPVYGPTGRQYDKVFVDLANESVERES